MIRYGEHLIVMDEVGAICHFSTANAKFYDVGSLQSFVIKYDEGKIKRLTRGNFLGMIFDDLELYQEFLRQDSFKQMKASMPEYIRRYNERNPVSFSE